VPWIFLGQVHVSFQLPPNQTLTVALLPFRCPDNGLPFSIYSYLQEGSLLATSTRGSDPTRVLGELSLLQGSKLPMPCVAVSPCDSPTAQRCPGLTPACLAPQCFPRAPSWRGKRAAPCGARAVGSRPSAPAPGSLFPRRKSGTPKTSPCFPALPSPVSSLGVRCSYEQGN